MRILLQTTCAASAEALAPALAISCGVFDADAAIKIQRKHSGAFACHYDNAGPPSKRSVTAVLYLGREDGAAVAEDHDGGALCLAPFLRRRAAAAAHEPAGPLQVGPRPPFGREGRRGASPRLCVSFWFEGPVNAPEDLVLTRDRLRFRPGTQAAEFL